MPKVTKYPGGVTGEKWRAKQAKKWKKRAFNSGEAELTAGIASYRHDLETHGHGFYKESPQPYRGYIEYGRAGDLPHRKDGSVKFKPRKFVEHYDPIYGQVVLKPVKKARRSAAQKAHTESLRKPKMAGFHKSMKKFARTAAGAEKYQAHRQKLALLETQGGSAKAKAKHRAAIVAYKKRHGIPHSKGVY